MKRTFLQIASMVGNRYAAFLGQVFKLDMGTVLFIFKPAVIMQKFQNFPNRHIIIIRVFYTYIKGFLEKKLLFFRRYVCFQFFPCFLYTLIPATSSTITPTLRLSLFCQTNYLLPIDGIKE
jgi:hypothetical protein